MPSVLQLCRHSPAAAGAVSRVKNKQSQAKIRKTTEPDTKNHFPLIIVCNLCLYSKNRAHGEFPCSMSDTEKLPQRTTSHLSMNRSYTEYSQVAEKSTSMNHFPFLIRQLTPVTTSVQSDVEKLPQRTTSHHSTKKVRGVHHSLNRRDSQ